jgi:glyoxylate carboligase
MSEQPVRMSGAQALVKSLELEGVEVIFGLPGGAILPVYDPILDSPIRHILVRHEQGAGHMAEGYAHATGRPGVAMVTSGPAATNIVTPLCDAFMDSVPMVVITGQVPVGAIGTDAFQECDTIGITRSVTKHNELVTRARDIPLAVRQAFLLATTGRPGPVLLDIPKDIVDAANPNAQMEWYWPTDEEVWASLPGYRPTTKGHPRKIKEAAELIMAASANRSSTRRRHSESAGGDRVARARRADRHPRGHHAHGPRRLPRRPPARPRHARHARQLHRGHGDAGVRPADRARQPIRRPCHRASCRPSPPTQR